MYNLHVDVSLNPLGNAIVDYYSAFYGRGVPAIIRGMIRRHIRSQKNLDWAELACFAEVFLKKNYPGQATVHQGVRDKLQAFEDKVKGRATEGGAFVHVPSESNPGGCVIGGGFGRGSLFGD
jgi:hypothetical protein